MDDQPLENEGGQPLDMEIDHYPEEGFDINSRPNQPVITPTEITAPVDKDIQMFNAWIWPDWAPGASPGIAPPQIMNAWLEACNDVRVHICCGKNPIEYAEIPDVEDQVAVAEGGAPVATTRKSKKNAGSLKFAFMALTYIFFLQRLEEVRQPEAWPEVMSFEEAKGAVADMTDIIKGILSQPVWQTYAARDAIGPLVENLILVEYGTTSVKPLPCASPLNASGRTQLAILGRLLTDTAACGRVVRLERRFLKLLDRVARELTGFHDDKTAPHGLEAYQLVRWLYDWHRNREVMTEGKLLLWSYRSATSGYQRTLPTMLPLAATLPGRYALVEKFNSDIRAIGVVASSDEVRRATQETIWRQGNKCGIQFRHFSSFRYKPPPGEEPPRWQPAKRFERLGRRLEDLVQRFQQEDTAVPTVKKIQDSLEQHVALMNLEKEKKAGRKAAEERQREEIKTKEAKNKAEAKVLEAEIKADRKAKEIKEKADRKAAAKERIRRSQVEAAERRKTRELSFSSNATVADYTVGCHEARTSTGVTSAPVV